MIHPIASIQARTQNWMAKHFELTVYGRRIAGILSREEATVQKLGLLMGGVTAQAEDGAEGTDSAAGTSQGANGTAGRTDTEGRA